MANGTRDNAPVGQLTDLYFQFLKNGDPYTPYQFIGSKIYSSYDDALNDTNEIFDLTSTGDSSEITTGKFKYTVPIINTAGTYYDRVFIIPDNGNSVWDPFSKAHISPFYIRKVTVGGGDPLPHEKIKIHLNIFDVLDIPQKGGFIKVKMNVPYAWYGEDLIESQEETLYVSASGSVLGKDGLPGFDLIETETLTADTFPDTGDTNEVFYKVNIASKKFVNVRVPKGIVQSNFKDLPVVE